MQRCPYEIQFQIVDIVYVNEILYEEYPGKRYIEMCLVSKTWWTILKKPQFRRPLLRSTRLKLEQRREMDDFSHVYDRISTLESMTKHPAFSSDELLSSLPSYDYEMVIPLIWCLLEKLKGLRIVEQGPRQLEAEWFLGRCVLYYDLKLEKMLPKCRIMKYPNAHLCRDSDSDCNHIVRTTIYSMKPLDIGTEQYIFEMTDRGLDMIWIAPLEKVAF